MSETARPTGWRDLFRRRILPVLAILIVIGITAGIYLTYGRHPEKLAALEDYVYWGAFLISLIGNATIILPGAVLIILSEISVILYPMTGPIGPIAVGFVGGAGAAIGEITGYMAGYGGRTIVERIRVYQRVEGWMRRWGGIAVFLMSVFPFFFDLAGIAAGVLRYPFWKFFVLCWLGRTILYVVFILLAALGFSALPYPG